MKIKEFANVINGATPSSAHDEYYGGNIVWFTPKDLSDQNSKYISKGERTLTQKGYDSCSTKMLPAGSLLMSSRAPIGLLAISKVDCCTNQGFKNFDIDKQKCDVDYLYYFLKSHKNEIEKLGSGTTFKEVSKETIENFEINLPSLPNQKKIASVLSALDDKIALNKKMNQKLEAMAKRLYDYWFVQFDFPDENGRPYKTSGGPMTYNETLKREIPSGWEVKKITDLASFEKESIRPSEEPNVLYKHFSIPGFDDCGSYVLEKGESILSDKFIVSESDILVSKLNPWTSRVVWGEGLERQICSTEFVVMKLEDAQEKGFLYSMVKQPSFIDYCTRGSSGTSHSHRRVNPEYMMDFIFAYDRRVVQKFSTIVSEYALMMMKNLRENRKLTTLRDKLLPLLMNGQVEVK